MRAGGRLPGWLRRRMPAEGYGATRAVLARLALNTVCDGANCPNQGECFSRGTATFMIMGSVCTRSCTFCAVPECAAPGPLDEGEPERVAEAAAALGLRHVVVTSVTRDDLPDGGAVHFARTIAAIRRRCPEATVEVLVPDFAGSVSALDTVLGAGPDVLNHNVETVPRLYPEVRPQADYTRSLALLERAGRAGFVTKSGFMLGLGEREEEVERVLQDLRSAGVAVVTIGQYLAPSPLHHPVVEFVEPGRFGEWERRARRMGFAAVAAGPFVRSSYMAERVLERALGARCSDGEGGRG